MRDPPRGVRGRRRVRRSLRVRRRRGRFLVQAGPAGVEAPVRAAARGRAPAFVSGAWARALGAGSHCAQPDPRGSALPALAPGGPARSDVDSVHALQSDPSRFGPLVVGGVASRADDAGRPRSRSPGARSGSCTATGGGSPGEPQAWRWATPVFSPTYPAIAPVHQLRLYVATLTSETRERSLPLPGRCIRRPRHRPRRPRRPPLSRANRSRAPTPPRPQPLSAEGRATPPASAADAGPVPTTCPSHGRSRSADGRVRERGPSEVARTASVRRTTRPDPRRCIAGSARSPRSTRWRRPNLRGAGARRPERPPSTRALPAGDHSTAVPREARSQPVPLRVCQPDLERPGRSRRRDLSSTDLADIGRVGQQPDTEADVVGLHAAPGVDAHDELAPRGLQTDVQTTGRATPRVTQGSEPGEAEALGRTGPRTRPSRRCSRHPRG